MLVVFVFCKRKQARPSFPLLVTTSDGVLFRKSVRSHWDTYDRRPIPKDDGDADAPEERNICRRNGLLRWRKRDHFCLVDNDAYLHQLALQVEDPFYGDRGDVNERQAAVLKVCESQRA